MVGERLELSGDPEWDSGGSVLTVSGDPAPAAAVAAPSEAVEAAIARDSSLLRFARRMRWISHSVLSLSCVMPFLRALRSCEWNES